MAAVPAVPGVFVFVADRPQGGPAAPIAAHGFRGI